MLKNANLKYGYAPDSINGTMTLDFASYQTYVWSVDCLQAIDADELQGEKVSCSKKPTNAKNVTYNATGSGVDISNYDMHIGGFYLNGKGYPDILSGAGVRDGLGRFDYVFAVDKIYEDSWLYNQNSGSGSIGFSPNSPQMWQYIDPTSL